MRLLDFLEYSVSPWMRFTACGVLGSALYFLYRWDPERRSQEEENDRLFSEISPQPPASRTALATFYGDRPEESEVGDKTRSTVIELEQYLDALAHSRVESLDRV
ncbi:MAG: hypothetical protein ABIH23_19555 [bacterium]